MSDRQFIRRDSLKLGVNDESKRKLNQKEENTQRLKTFETLLLRSEIVWDQIDFDKSFMSYVFIDRFQLKDN